MTQDERQIESARRSGTGEGQEVLEPDQTAARPATVLIVDDNEAMLAACRDILEAAGYKALVAHDGSEGMEIFRPNHREIGVVVMDWILPSLGGDQWVDLLLQVDPETKIVFITAQFLDEDTHRRLAPKVERFLKKPFEGSDLLAAVAQAFGAAPGS